MRLRSLAYALIVVVFSVVILAYTRDQLMPFLFALMFWYLIRSTRMQVSRLDWVEKSIPHSLQNLIAASLLFLIAGLVVMGLVYNVRSFLSSLDLYEKNLNLLNQRILQLSGWNLLKELRQYTGSLSISTVLQPLARVSFSLISNVLLVSLYTVFLLSEERRFADKIKDMFEDKQQYDSVRQVAGQIDEVCSRFLLLKTVVSFLTALVNYLILLALGVKFAFLWAFLIFVSSYIPNIGALVGTAFPVAAAFLQFGSIEFGLLTLGWVGLVQILSGNVIEPMVLSDSMNLSPLVLLVMLVFWGTLWGFVGMFLSVPLTMMCLIVFYQLPSTRRIAILLSGTGEIGFVKATQTKGA